MTKARALTPSGRVPNALFVRLACGKVGLGMAPVGIAAASEKSMEGRSVSPARMAPVCTSSTACRVWRPRNWAEEDYGRYGAGLH